MNAVQNNGAYLQLLTPSISHLTLFVVPGPYAIPQVSITIDRRSRTPRRPTPTAAPAGPRPPTASSG